MSHFAEIDQNKKVIRVLVGDNNEPDEGQAIIESLGGTWVKTSYNAKIRYNFAGIGYTYDPIDDAFIPPQPYPSWVLNESKQWKAPISYPNDNKMYYWDESAGNWVERN